MASGDLRWQEFEEDSWIDSVKSSHDFVGFDHVSSFSYNNNNSIYLYKVQYPMYIEVRVQWTI